ncbi:hypothetical protein [Marinomonas sp.]|uniref:hypothetical protein n=1 Tax=Marinomonas sp. TaxID=1904862 RepID=UPI003BAB0107
MDNHTTLTLGTTQTSIGLLYVILAFFIGVLAANNADLENYLWLEFFQTENFTVHSCFSENYSDFYYFYKFVLRKPQKKRF